MEQPSTIVGWHSRCNKSRSGCVTCKKRKLKCDETKPSCNRCVKSGLTCPGYKKPVKWSTKYEINYEPFTHARPATDALARSASRLETIIDPLVLGTLRDESSTLLSHYFSDVCRVASSFDSPQNPYRSLMSDMICHSPIIFNCVMMMSASHLYQQGNHASAPLIFQTEAISHISKRITEIELGSNALVLHNKDTNPSQIQSSHTSTVQDDLLLGIILIGMTSSWYDPSSLGVCHFHGARQLFNIWMTENKVMEIQLPYACTHHLIISSMVYWEVMAACLIDQDIETLSYLDVFYNQRRAFFSYPCPWTGIGLGILIHLAKCMTLVRQRRSKHTTMCATTCLNSDFDLMGKVFSLAQEVDQIYIPDVTEIQDTRDPFTSPDHLYKIAQCHRLVAKLELSRNFPELCTSFTNHTDPESTSQFQEVGHDQKDLHFHRTLRLAIEILEIMQTIPEDSRSMAIQTLIFLSAGSVLGPCSTADPRIMEQISGWRQFVLERLYKSFHALKLQTIIRSASILVEVWSRMDSMATEVLGCGSFIMHVHWMDVMIENRLETILG